MKLQGMSKGEYITLKDIGMLHKFFSEATGSWVDDCGLLDLSSVKVEVRGRDIESIYGVSEELTHNPIDRFTKEELFSVVKDSISLLHNDGIIQVDEWFLARESLDNRVDGMFN